MRIVNDLGIPVKACAYFVYKGAHVSCSTLGESLCVVVWEGNTTGVDNPLFEGVTVQSAIEFINSQ